MRFKIGDRVRVSKSAVEDYIGIEGVIVAVDEDTSAIFNSYTLQTGEGEKVTFLEYQLEPAL